MAAPAATFAQERTIAPGTWQGVLKAGVDLHLVFTFSAAPVKASLACPEQGFKGLPADTVMLKGDSLVVEFRKLGARYAGRFEGDTAVNGQWQQGMSLPMRISRTSTPVALSRPQQPVPPFPYISRDVTYTSADRSITYAGTLTEPNGAGPFPAIVLITGSGQQNRDEEVFGHKPFAVLADYLTRRGFAVLRVDDRGIGGTTGSAANATSSDFAGDVSYGLDFLRKQPEIDKKRLGLMGHSEGGIIAPMVAQRRNDVSFMVLLAGPGINGAEVMTLQNEAVMRSKGRPAAQADFYVTFFRQMLHLFAERPVGRQTAALDSLLTNWMARTPAATVEELTGIKDEATKQSFINESVQELGSEWFHYFLSYDPAPAIESYKGKLLALNGSRDLQVTSSANLDAIRAAISKHHRPAQEAIELPGLNHLFQTCHSCGLEEYAQLTETFSPTALDTIGRWLDRNVIKSK